MTFLRTLGLSMLLLVGAGCESGVAIGTLCVRASDCAAPTVCQFGRCRAECVENRDCPTGASCLTTRGGLGACSVDVDLGCETGVGRMCASGLVCVTDRCVATCADASDCPADGECRPGPVPAVSFCFDPRIAVPDAGQLDGSSIDGGAAGPASGCRSLCMEGGDGASPGDIERACAVCDGHVYCWGHDADDGLGEGVGMAAVRGPVPVVDGAGVELSGMAEVVCGDTHACALRDTGEVLCWGADPGGRGLFGSAGASTQPRAVAVSGIGLGDAIAAGQNHTCLRLRGNGEVVCWGENAQGQCDPRPSYVMASPDAPASQPIAGASPFPARPVALLGAARLRTCVADMDRGLLRCVGLGEFASTGTVSDALSVALGTTAISVPVGLTELAMGRGHACLIVDGAALCFGGDTYGALGQGDTGQLCDGTICTATPSPIIGAAIALAHIGSGSGSDHTCAGGVDTGLTCWGRNDRSQCGMTTPGVDRLAPTPVREMATRRVFRVATSQVATCAITDEARVGVVWCWGGNRGGQLGQGNGDTDDVGHPIPARVTIP